MVKLLGQVPPDPSNPLKTLRPPGIFSPEAGQLPQPKFAQLEDTGATAVPSEALTDSEATGEAICEADATIEAVRQLLVERLQQLRASQRQSIIQYLQYAMQLKALQSSSSDSSSGYESAAPTNTAVLLGTHPPQTQATARISNSSPVRLWSDAVTLMLKNLPWYYTQDMLMSTMLACSFEGLFDFLYVPCDANRGCNLGYAIVNFTEPEYAMRFQAAMANRFLDEEMMRTGQRLVVEPADVQGYEANYGRLALNWEGQPPLSRSQLSSEIQMTGFLDIEEAGASAAVQLGHFQ